MAGAGAAKTDKKAKGPRPCEDYDVGKTVSPLDALALRSGEEIDSSETAWLTCDDDCLVVEHGVLFGGRRLQVRHGKTRQLGWVSCATKGGRPLIELTDREHLWDELYGAAEEESAAPLLPLEDILASLEEEDKAAETDGRKPDAGGLEGVLAALDHEDEADAVWRSFSDLGRVDRAEAMSAVVPALDPVLELNCFEELDERQADLVNDRRLRLMQAERAKREAKSRKWGMKVEKAKQAAGAAGKAAPLRTREIRRVEALPGGPAAVVPGTSSSSSSAPSAGTPNPPGPLMPERPDAGGTDHPPPPAASGEGREEEAPHCLLQPDAAVRVQGLRSAPELNGAGGTCEWWDAERRRWRIRLESGETKLFRPQNLVACGDPPAPSAATVEASVGWAPDFGGAYVDSCGTRYNLHQSGSVVTEEKTAEFSSGSARGNQLAIFGMTGTMSCGRICWSNGMIWTRLEVPEGTT